MEPDLEPGSFGVELLRRIGRRLLRIPAQISWVPALAWAALIWWLSSQEVIDPPPLIPALPVLGNLVHAVEFGMLALWAVLVLPRRNGWPVIDRATIPRCLVPMFAYALVDEWHQSAVPHRNASLLDVLTDAVGIVSVLWVIAYLGQGRADGPGLGRRLAIGMTGCLCAAWLATAYGNAYGRGPWPW